MKTITTEKEYKDVCQQMNSIINKGTELGDMELLPEMDKNEYIRLSEIVRKWEAAHYPFPIVVNPLVANIRSKMNELNITQKEVSRMIGINEARISEIMRGKRRININIAKKLNKSLHIPADVILEFA
jgi:antitoxin component HigA of HigAB toxin-antitoxin module